MSTTTVAYQPPPVHEIVGLLNKYSPETLLGLKKAFPNEVPLFEPGIPAGREEDDALAIRVEITRAGMEVIVSKGDAHLRKLQKRMNLGHQLKFAAQLLTVLAT